MNSTPFLPAVPTTLLVLMVWAASAAASVPGEPMEQSRLTELVEGIREAQPPIFALPLVRELDFHAHYVSRAVLLEQLEGLLDESSGLHPLVRLELGELEAKLLYRAGDARADAVARSHGFVTSWKWIGPFATTDLDRLEAVFPPEECLDLSQTYDGLYPELPWQELHPSWWSTRLMPELNDDHGLTGTVVYLAQDFDVPEAVDAVLWLTPSGVHGLRVWLDGALVGEWREGQPGESDGYPMRLEAGPHRLALKLVIGSWPSLQPRWTTAALEALVLEEASVSEACRPLSSSNQLPGRVNGKERVLLEALSALPTSLQSPLISARVAYSFRCGFPPTEFEELGGRMMEEALSSVQSAPHIAELAVVAIGNRAEDAVAEALLVAPDDPWLVLARFRAVKDQLDRSEEAAALLDRLLTLQPDSAVSLDARLDWLTLSWDTRLSESIYQAVVVEGARFPVDLPCIAQWREQAADRSVLRRAEWQQYAAWLEQVDAEQSYSLWGLTLERARYYTARECQFIPSACLSAELLTSAGRLEEARDEIERTLVEFPTLSRVLARAARWYEEHGERGRALELWRRSLLYDPSNSNIRGLLEYLDASPLERQQSPWAIVEPGHFELIPPGEDYGLLVDQRVVHLAANGSQEVWEQQVFEIFTEDGAAALSTLVFRNASRANMRVRRVEILRADGSLTEVLAQTAYYARYSSGTIVEPPALAPGDRLDLRLEGQLDAPFEAAAPPFAALWTWHFDEPRRFLRYVLIGPPELELTTFVPSLPQAHFDSHRDSEAATWTFEMRDLPALEREPGMPPELELAPPVQLGAFRSWDELALWYQRLEAPQRVVDDAMRETVASLVSGVTDEREKLRRIHGYVLEHTRYVSDRFSTHNFIPTNTWETLSRGYGDCKDLSLLLLVLLEEAGISARLALVRTRQLGRLDTTVPTAFLFNHVVVYLPTLDLFVDTTAQHSGLDELPPMDQGVSALIIDTEGKGVLRLTPEFPASKNVIRREYTLTLGDEQTQVVGTLTATGAAAAGYRSRYVSSGAACEDLQENLNRAMPGICLEECSYDVTEREHPAVLTFSGTWPSAVIQQREGLALYPLGRPSELGSGLAVTSERKLDLELGLPKTFEHVQHYRLPTELVPRRLPEAVLIDNDFGQLSLDFEATEDGLTVRSVFSLHTWRVAAERYPEFRDFVLEVDRLLNQPILLDAKPSHSSALTQLGETGQAPNQQKLGTTGQAPNQQKLGTTGQAPNQQKQRGVEG